MRFVKCERGRPIEDASSCSLIVEGQHHQVSDMHSSCSRAVARCARRTGAKTQADRAEASGSRVVGERQREAGPGACWPRELGVRASWKLWASVIRRSCRVLRKRSRTMWRRGMRVATTGTPGSSRVRTAAACGPCLDWSSWARRRDRSASDKLGRSESRDFSSSRLGL